MSMDNFAIPQTILRHFDLASTSYTEAGAGETSARRRLYPDGKLFIDQLLGFAELDGRALYPPTSPAGLRRLLHAIHSSQQDRLKKDCYFYYLLRDHDAATSRPQANGYHNADHANGDGDGEPDAGRAEAFAKRRCIPRTWRVFMDGYWALDHAQWEFSVKCLSDPSVSELNFVPQIIHTLATQVSPPSRAMHLLRSFFITASVQLPSPLERDTKVLALASAGSLLEAFKYLREHQPEDRARMRERIWSWALGASAIPCGAGQHGVHPKTLQEMLHLPLNEEEHAHLIHFLSHPPRSITPPALSALHDLVTLRLVHQGQYAESLQLDKASAGLAGADTDRQRRREMVRDFTAILPAVQRRALAIDSDERANALDTDGPLVNGYGAETEDVEMDHSWIALNSPARAGIMTNGDSSTPGVKPSTSHLSLAPSGSASPAPNRSPLPRPNSPFTGPPRFASNSRLGSPGPVNRILSGSPFALPSSRVVSRHGSPAPGPTRIIDDDDMPVDSPRPRNLSVGSMSRQSLRDMVLRPQSRPESPRPPDQADHEDRNAVEQPEEAMEPHEPREPETEPELEVESPPEVPPEPEPRRIRSTRRKPKTEQTKPKAPTPQPEPSPDREATPPVASPPPSPPSHHTRSHDTPSSPHSMDEVPPRSTRSRRGGRTSMPGAFDPHEEPIPEDQVLPPTPAPTSTRSKTRTQTEADPPRSRITRSASRAQIDEDDHIQAPPKRTRRNAREGSATSQISTISETPGASLVRRSTRGRRGDGAAEGKSSTRARGRTGATPASERASPTPSNATSVSRGQLVGTGTRRSTRREASVEDHRGATSTRRTTRRR